MIELEYDDGTRFLLLSCGLALVPFAIDDIWAIMLFTITDAKNGDYDNPVFRLGGSMNTKQAYNAYRDIVAKIDESMGGVVRVDEWRKIIEYHGGSV